MQNPFYVTFASHRKRKRAFRRYYRAEHVAFMKSLTPADLTECKRAETMRVKWTLERRKKLQAIPTLRRLMRAEVYFKTDIDSKWR